VILSKVSFMHHTIFGKSRVRELLFASPAGIPNVGACLTLK
jgi:hypothetical protein